MALKAESPRNFETKTICCFVLDVSASMGGEPIKELNRGLKSFHEEIQNNETTSQRLEVAIVTFDDRVKVVQSPELVDNFSPSELIVGGTTKLVDGVREALRLVEDRKQWYRQTGQQYLRPWIVLITDGAPDQGQDAQGLAREIQEGMSGKKFMFLAVGVKGADMNMLRSISSSLEGQPVGPFLLQGLKFHEFFEWMSASMAVVSGSIEGDRVALPKADNWINGFQV
ncbi:MAG: vWA domain-containing protein [Methylomagnum sp.]